MEDVKLLLLEVKMSYICNPGPMINNFILLVKATKLPHETTFFLYCLTDWLWLYCICIDTNEFRLNTKGRNIFNQKHISHHFWLIQLQKYEIFSLFLLLFRSGCQWKRIFLSIWYILLNALLVFNVVFFWLLWKRLLGALFRLGCQ